jgi:lysophospholipase L1-like esterase
MKLVFVGDSLTAAVPGVSFVEMVKVAYPNDEVLNYGKGGDTVTSLNTRMLEMRVAKDIDIMVVCIGVNDVFVQTGWWHPTLKKVMKQPWVKDKHGFYLAYHTLITTLLPLTNRLVLIPPLLVGEDINNKSNRLLAEYFEEVQSLIELYQCPVLPVRDKMIEALSNKTIVDYVPKRLGQLRKDVLKLTSPELVDAASSKRGLHLTLDGVHLNTQGATIVFDEINNYLKEKL